MEREMASAIAFAVISATLLAGQRERWRRFKIRSALRTSRAFAEADKVLLEVEGMMCQKNCGSTVEKALRNVPGTLQATVVQPKKLATVIVPRSVSNQALLDAVEAVGFEASVKMRIEQHGLIPVRMAVEGMMCEKNCASTVRKALSNAEGVVQATVSLANKSALVMVYPDVNPDALVQVVEAVGFGAKLKTAVSNRRPSKASGDKLRHACFQNIVGEQELTRAFQGVKKYHHEQQLEEYSRYKNWTQSCYMECHDHWSPQVPITEPLRDCMLPLLDKCKAKFAKWYCELYGLEDVEVITLNSFVTKYVPVEGKSEFGKHVDSAKADGSLILSLPTDEPHDWPGIKIWDGPKDASGNTPEHNYVLHPGDICCMDKLVWHHGLPISKGVRYVAVCFYQCKWKKVKMGK